MSGLPSGHDTVLVRSPRWTAAAGALRSAVRPKARSCVRQRCIGVSGGHDAAAPGTGRSKAALILTSLMTVAGAAASADASQCTHRGHMFSRHSSSSCEEAADWKPGGPRRSEVSFSGRVRRRSSTADPAAMLCGSSHHEDEPKGTEAAGNRRARGPRRRCCSCRRGWRRRRRLLTPQASSGHPRPAKRWWCWPGGRGFWRAHWRGRWARLKNGRSGHPGCVQLDPFHDRLRGAAERSCAVHRLPTLTFFPPPAHPAVCT